MGDWREVRRLKISRIPGLDNVRTRRRRSSVPTLDVCEHGTRIGKQREKKKKVTTSLKEHTVCSGGIETQWRGLDTTYGGGGKVRKRVVRRV